ncbi:MAG: hypothetical protein ACRDXB_21300, partial [Actinomycetes bacterium]
MNARTELIALLECVVPLDRAGDMVDRHHAEVASPLQRSAVLAEEDYRRVVRGACLIEERLRAQVAALLALHRKHTDSDHCEYDGEVWPCPTVEALAMPPVTDLAKAV